MSDQNGSELCRFVVEIRHLVMAEARREIRGDLRGYADGEDIYQETCTVVSLHADEFTKLDPDKRVAWALSIARHRARDYLRRHHAAKRRRRGGPREQRMEFHDLAKVIFHLGTPDQGAITGDLLRRANAAMAALPDDQRTAIRMFYIEGESLSSIGQHLNRSADAVDHLRRRALKAIQARLGPDLLEGGL